MNAGFQVDGSVVLVIGSLLNHFGECQGLFSFFPEVRFLAFSGEGSLGLQCVEIGVWNKTYHVFAWSASHRCVLACVLQAIDVSKGVSTIGSLI